MSEEKRPFKGKRPFGNKPFGKKPFGKKFGDRNYGDRPSRPEGSAPREGGGDRPFRKKPYGDKPRFDDRGGRPGGFRSGKPGGFGRPDRGDRPQGERGDRPNRFDRGPRFDRGDRPDRGPRPNRVDRPDRGPRPNREDRPARRDDSPFRGMYSGPASEEDRERRRNRPYRPDPRAEAEPSPLDLPQPVTPAAEGGERPHLGENELRYLGKNACLGLWKARPDDVVRVYVLREKSEEFADLIEFCAKNRKSYHLVGEGDLERLTDSIHHQGICVIAKAKRFFREENFFRELGAHRTLVIYLDGVANPHNLGAILRTAAHFGVKFVCVPKDEITKISPALYRTAEGGAELVNLVRVEDTEKFLDRLRSQGFQLYAFEPGAKAISLFETRLNEKSVFVFGAEVEGLSGIVKTIVETKVTIPGTGGVESLNVSVAAAVAMAEFEKQSVNRTVRIVKNRT